MTEMKEGKQEGMGSESKGGKRGRVKKGKVKLKKNWCIRDKKKLFLDYTDDPKKHEEYCKLLEELNHKKLGSEIFFQNLVEFAISALDAKALEKLKESSYQIMDKIELECEKYNQKNGTNLTSLEYIGRKMGIA